MIEFSLGKFKNGYYPGEENFLLQMGGKWLPLGERKDLKLTKAEYNASAKKVCKTCVYWEGHGESSHCRTCKGGKSGSSDEGEMFSFTDIYTEAKFGCVNWERRRSESDEKSM